MLLLLPLLILCLSSPSGAQEEGRVQKDAAQVNFTHHSHVDEAQDKSFKITNFIRNDSDRPLSVKWDRAGILCTGDLQLPPRQTDYGTSGGVTYRPILLDNSEIKYGLGLQYLANARVYIDSQNRNTSEARTSAYERKDKDGKTQFRVEVTSAAVEGSATITIRVTGSLSLVASPDVLRRVERSGSIHAEEGWKVDTPYSLQTAGLKEKANIDVAQEWLGRQEELLPEPLRPPGGGGGGAVSADVPHYLVLHKKGHGTGVVRLTLNGSAFSPRRLSLVGFIPDRQGVIGVSADVFLPEW